MKKWICLLLLAVLLLSGCASERADVGNTDTEKEKDKSTLFSPQKERSHPSGKDNNRPYYIKVNHQANTVTVYRKDFRGDYSIPIRAMICSTGTYTPQEGVFPIGGENCWPWLALQGDVFGQYCTQIKDNILFHSVPYTKSHNKSSLEYEEFDKLGTSCSAGCIRLQVCDAKWIYDHAMQIYAVEFYADTFPGPLGRPQAPKVSDNVKCRGWDPSDEDAYNPWLHPDAPQPPESYWGGGQSHSKVTNKKQTPAKPQEATSAEKTEPTTPTEQEKNDPTPTKPTEQEKNDPTPMKPTEQEKNDPTPTKPTEQEKSDPTPTESEPTEQTEPTKPTKPADNVTEGGETEVTEPAESAA